MIESQLNGKSLDIVSENIKKLKEWFPEIVSEDKIDFIKLKNIFGDYAVDTDEKYNFSWAGKSEALKESQKISEGTLNPCKNDSRNWDTTKNLYIEGDNLEVLKLLQKSYYNKIKMIYIDPPFNTGKDFIYPDNYSDNMGNYLEITNQINIGGGGKSNSKLTSNLETNGRFHTNWLNMMYPRLRLARNLLNSNGLIFVSIDDNELNNLKKLMDEIYGEDNFIAQISWFKNYGKNESHFYSNNMEYILVYCKNFDRLNSNNNNYFLISKKGFNEVSNLIKKIKNENISLKEGENEIKFLYKSNPKFKGIKAYNKLDDNYELWRPVSMEKPKDPCYFYDIIHPITKKPCKIPKKGWRMPQSTMKNLLENNLVVFGKDEKTIPNRKYFLKDVKYETPKNFIDNSNQGGNEILKLFHGKHIFDYPKPTSLIKELINTVIKDEDILIDFFAGSSTTADALMQLNNEDNIYRKFIMVQIPEKTPTNSVPYNEGYINICDIGKERIRRAGDKIVEETGNKDLDIGFKVFKLGSSNLTKWNPDIDNLEDSLVSNINNIVPGKVELDLVYEIMLKYGIDLTVPVEEIKIKDNKIYSVGFGALLICLEDNITSDLAEDIIKIKNGLDSDVIRVVFKDNGFKSDSDKTNVKETLRANNIDEFITI